VAVLAALARVEQPTLGCERGWVLGGGVSRRRATAARADERRGGHHAAQCRRSAPAGSSGRANSHDRILTRARRVRPAALPSRLSGERGPHEFGRRAMPDLEPAFDNTRDVSVLLSPPWQSGRRGQLGRTICVQTSSGYSRSRSHSLERAVISLDGGVAAPCGDARCSLHAARASRIGAGGRGRGFPGDGAASRRRTAGAGEGGLRRSDCRRARGMESKGLRRDPDFERTPGLNAMAAHGAAQARRAADGCARAPRAGGRSGRRLAPRRLRPAA